MSQIVVIQNSVFNGKTQLIEGDRQTKLAYFFLLKITYRITTEMPFNHFIGPI